MNEYLIKSMNKKKFRQNIISNPGQYNLEEIDISIKERRLNCSFFYKITLDENM